jgi:hypothetical protein
LAPISAASKPTAPGNLKSYPVGTCSLFPLRISAREATRQLQRPAKWKKIPFFAHPPRTVPTVTYLGHRLSTWLTGGKWQSDLAPKDQGSHGSATRPYWGPVPIIWCPLERLREMFHVEQSEVGAGDRQAARARLRFPVPGPQTDPRAGMGCRDEVFHVEHSSLRAG